MQLARLLCGKPIKIAHVLGLELFKAGTAKKPYGHVGYTKTSKTGKVSIVKPKGVKIDDSYTADKGDATETELVAHVKKHAKTIEHEGHLEQVLHDYLKENFEHSSKKARLADVKTFKDHLTEKGFVKLLEPEPEKPVELPEPANLGGIALRDTPKPLPGWSSLPKWFTDQPRLVDVQISKFVGEWKKPKPISAVPIQGTFTPDALHYLSVFQIKAQEALVNAANLIASVFRPLEDKDKLKTLIVEAGGSGAGRWNGLYDRKNKRIHISYATARDISSVLPDNKTDNIKSVQAFKTFIHESFHHASPANFYSEEPDIAMEEATTELCAQAMAADVCKNVFGVDVSTALTGIKVFQKNVSGHWVVGDLVSYKVYCDRFTSLISYCDDLDNKKLSEKEFTQHIGSRALEIKQRSQDHGYGQNKEGYATIIRDDNRYDAIVNTILKKFNLSKIVDDHHKKSQWKSPLNPKIKTQREKNIKKNTYRTVRDFMAGKGPFEKNPTGAKRVESLRQAMEKVMSDPSEDQLPKDWLPTYGQ